MRPTLSYNESDYYEYYINSIDSSLYYVEKTVYKAIILDFFKEIQRLLLVEAKSVKLPARLGRIQIIKKRPKSWLTSSKPIDFKLSRELGMLVYHLNEHSDGFKYRLHWDKKESNMKNKTRYQMIMCRDNKRGLAKLIKTRQQDYIELN